MNTEDFFHIGNNEVLYVKNKGKNLFLLKFNLEEGSTKFSYKSLLSLYKNLGLLGEGGYGTVYLLEHSISKEKVAAKFVNVQEYLK